MTAVLVPLTARYVFGESGTRMFIGAGAQLAFLQSAKLRTFDGVDRNLESALESRDVSVVLDLGVKSHIRWFHWFVQGRIGIGLVDMAAGDPFGTGDERVIWKTRSAQLLGGVS